MKRIIICCDGTWNRIDQLDRIPPRPGDDVPEQPESVPAPTNVAKFAMAVVRKGDDHISQEVYYQRGVGTSQLHRVRGGAFGLGLLGNVQRAYRFLVDLYEPGDEIFLLGFSRGAYTVRALAGLIRNCGILKQRYAAEEASNVLRFYLRRLPRTTPDAPSALLLRKTYSNDTRIKFVGVWDTVGALGIPMGPLRSLRRGMIFHDTYLSMNVENAFHALAIDEQRRPFVPALWLQQARAVGQRLEQVWFCGVHSNIGGGYADTGLSDITLVWMINRAVECGLRIDKAEVWPAITPDPFGAIRDSMTIPYKLLALRRVRPICESWTGGRSREVLHPSVMERWEEMQDYRPLNLMGLLGRTGGAPALSQE